MFDFISNILESITHFFTQAILLIIIVLAVVLLFLATHRHNHNPYVDHSQEIQKQQIEAEREANTRRLCNASMTNNMENKPTTESSPWDALSTLSKSS